MGGTSAGAHIINLHPPRLPPLYPPLPLNILSPLLPRALIHRSHRLTAHTVFLIQPNPINQNSQNQSWLAFVDELNPGKLAFRYPLSKYSVFRFSGYVPKSAENVPNVINLLDLRVVEVGKSYALGRFLDVMNKIPGQFDLNLYWNDGYDKVLLFPEADQGWGYSLGVVRQDGSFRIYNLEDDAWFGLRDYSGLMFDDVVNYKGKIFGIERKRKTYTIDYVSYEIVQVAVPVPKLARRRKRLVVSETGLFLVVMDNKFDEEFVRLRAYKLEEEEGRWVEVTSLDDQVLFVGGDCSFSFSAQVCSGFQRNCIYAFRNSFRRYNIKKNEDQHERCLKEHYEIGIFHLGIDGSFRPLETFDMLWPPPSWLASNS